MKLTEQKLRRIIRAILLESPPAQPVRILGVPASANPSRPYNAAMNPARPLKKVQINPTGKAFKDLDGYAKNKQLHIYDDLLDDENEILRNDIFDLIDRSYAYIGGNADIRTSFDLADPAKNDYVEFLAWDIDDDPEADVVRGMKPKGGKMKLTLSANDGSRAAVDYGIDDTIVRLKDGNHYAEMSGKSATVQMKAGTPAVTDESTARAMLPGKKIEWFGSHPYFSGDERFQDRGSEIEAIKSRQYGGTNKGYDGWYVRSLGGTPHAKMIFGAV